MCGACRQRARSFCISLRPCRAARNNITFPASDPTIASNAVKYAVRGESTLLAATPISRAVDRGRQGDPHRIEIARTRIPQGP